MVKLLPSFISVNPMHCKSIVKVFLQHLKEFFPLLDSYSPLFILGLCHLLSVSF